MVRKFKIPKKAKRVFKGVLFEALNFNINHSAQEIRNYRELTRSTYGV